MKKLMAQSVFSGVALLAAASCLAQPHGPRHGVSEPADTSTHAVEKLMNLVPKSAMVALAVNLEPGPKQQQVFQLLGAFIGKAKKMLSQSDDSSIPKELLVALAKEDIKGLVAFGEARSLKSSFKSVDPQKAMKLLTKGGRFGAMIPLRDRSHMEAALTDVDNATHVHANYSNGVRYHTVGPVKVMTLSHALVIASDDKTLADVKKAALTNWRFTSHKGFQRARRWYDDDATLLVMENMGASSQPWGGGALTLRDDGVRLAIGPFANGSGDSAGLPANYASTLPNGAYFVAGLAGSLLDLNKPGMQVPKELKQMLHGGSLGDLTVALYPSENRHGEAGGVDLLLEMGGSRKANPAKVFSQALKTLQQSLTGGMAVFSPMKLAGAKKAGELNAMFSVAMQNALQQAVKDSEKQVPARYLKNKTLCYATVGNSLMVATSKDLLKQAVRTARYHTNSLNNDKVIGPALRASRGKLLLVLIGNLKAIGQGLVSIMGNEMADAASIMKMAPGAAVISMTKDHGSVMANVYLPLTPLMVGVLGLSHMN
jgi:hypothetical protein